MGHAPIPRSTPRWGTITFRAGTVAAQMASARSLHRCSKTLYRKTRGYNQFTLDKRSLRLYVSAIKQICVTAKAMGASLTPRSARLFAGQPFENSRSELGLRHEIAYANRARRRHCPGDSFPPTSSWKYPNAEVVMRRASDTTPRMQRSPICPYRKGIR
jgi:hypothetical protein